MLDQLVESRDTGAENKRRSKFMLTVLIIALVTVVGLWTRDLFAHDYDMGGDDLSLTTLVAPVPVPDEEPPPEEKKVTEQKEIAADVRKELIASIDMSPKEPPPISTAKMTKATIRPEFNVIQGDRDANTTVRAEGGRGDVVKDGGPGGTLTSGGGDPETTAGVPPPPPPPPPKAAPKTVSGGVLNGKATSLPKPPYPAAARAVRASGAVTVQVTISESGSVISASAVSGHPLLRPAAVAAARQARFSPTLLTGQPVKVTGVITYNFTP